MRPYFFIILWKQKEKLDMKTTSHITGKQYNPGNDTVYISNMRQAQLYMRNGAELLDILYDNTKNDALVFVFKRSETRDLYEKWNNHELE
jgi:hypothetical protein